MIKIVERSNPAVHAATFGFSGYWPSFYYHHVDEYCKTFCDTRKEHIMLHLLAFEVLGLMRSTERTALCGCYTTEKR